MGKLLNMAVSEEFVSSGADVPTNEASALSINVRIGEVGTSGSGPITAPFSDKISSMATSGEIGIP